MSKQSKDPNTFFSKDNIQMTTMRHTKIYFNHYVNHTESDMVGHTYHPSTPEAKAGGWWIWS